MAAIETPDLAITCVLNGVNLDAGRDVNGYEMHADTRNTMGTTWRKQSVSNPWVEGSYDVIAVRENIIEAVVVWVYGNGSNAAFRQRVNFLEQAIAQPSYSIAWTVGDESELWDCTYSDYSVETQREWQYATMGIVRMQIGRRPKATFTYPDYSETV
jgi:hypothetical protein